MRLRKKHNLEARLEQGASVILDAPQKGAVKHAFLNPAAALHVEIGCGKGNFICTLAQRNPDVNFVAIERDRNVALAAIERVIAQEIPNVRFLVGNAIKMPDIFAEHEIARLYLNFSDPWHKKRHAKRRLTYRTWLQMYLTLLEDDGEIWFKTDNAPLYEFSLEEFDSCMERFFTTEDLHNSEVAADNIMTEYETAFSTKGFPIYAIRARKK